VLNADVFVCACVCVYTAERLGDIDMYRNRFVNIRVMRGDNLPNVLLSLNTHSHATKIKRNKKMDADA